MLLGDSFNSIKLLSVVIPAYKQSHTIVRDIANVEYALQSLPIRYEIIVVVDGIVDKTYENARSIKSPHVRVLGYKKNEGKGTAIRTGMLYAKGDVIGFIDAGMDINPSGFSMLLSHMEWYNADAIVGSKLHPVSKISYPLHRKFISFVYRIITRILFGFTVRDTQVGLKFFKKNLVQDVLPRLLVKRYAFDVELLAVAYNRGYKRIYEAPVEINFQQNTVQFNNLLPIIWFMMIDTLAVFYRLKMVRYYDSVLVPKATSAQKSILTPPAK